jgi:SAM-dependent methyltransferase
LLNKSAPYYDVIYDAAGKDYKVESKRLRQLIRRHKKSKGNELLDVADLDSRLLAIAKRRNTDVRLHQANMLTFNLHKQFDVVTCLFSAIGYMTTLRKLQRSIKNMSLHLKPGGVLIVEPWITARNFIKGNIHAVFVNESQLKIARIGRSIARGRTSTLNFQYLVATPRRTQYFRESEDFGLFSHSDYMNSFRLAGLKVIYYGKGLMERGLYVRIKT